MAKFDLYNNVLGANGQVYINCPAASTTTISRPCRPARILNNGTGTGAVTIYDNTAASGQIVWQVAAISAGASTPIDVPCTIGASIVTAAATPVLCCYT